MLEENKTGETGLIVYKGYRQQVKEFEVINSTIVFDYESKKGNKEARSHIAKMKKSKAAVEKVRIAEAKTYREALNLQAESIKSDIDKMILIHQTPLDAFENKEKIRIAAIEKRINDIFERDAGTTANEIQKEIDHVNLIDLDDGWEELLANAITAVTDRLKFLNDRLMVRKQYEADQEELAKLRREKEDREAKEKKDREDKRLADSKNQAQIRNDNAGEVPAVVAEGLSREDIEANFIPPSRGKLEYLGGDVAAQTKPESTDFQASEKTKTVKESRTEAGEDLAKIGFSEKQISLLIRSISFGKIRNIKFDL